MPAANAFGCSATKSGIWFPVERMRLGTHSFSPHVALGLQARIRGNGLKAKTLGPEGQSDLSRTMLRSRDASPVTLFQRRTMPTSNDTKAIATATPIAADITSVCHTRARYQRLARKPN
jgi:hypothetical protein